MIHRSAVNEKLVGNIFLMMLNDLFEKNLNSKLTLKYVYKRIDHSQAFMIEGSLV